jgi:nucleotide-binding universal stress UspA family protein
MTEEHPVPVFARIVCGVDATPESVDAVRQAVRLRPPGARVHLFGAVYIAGAIAEGWSEERITQQLEQEAGEALGRALEVAGEDVTSRLVNGAPAVSLLAELEREQATLVCVGRHTHHRLIGVALGYVATTMLHEAPCSVLVARTPPDPEAFPHSIVVGVDGSPQAAGAYAIASELARRFGAKLAPLSAYGGKYVGHRGAEHAVARPDTRAIAPSGRAPSGGGKRRPACRRQPGRPRPAGAWER